MCVNCSDPFDWVSYIFEALYETSVEDADHWWIRDTLSSWLEHKSVDEISIVSVIALLKSWGDFDTQNGQPE